MRLNKIVTTIATGLVVLSASAFAEVHDGNNPDQLELPLKRSTLELVEKKPVKVAGARYCVDAKLNVYLCDKYGNPLTWVCI